MESITNAVNSALGYGTQSDKEFTGNQLGEALQQSSTNQGQSDKELTGNQLSEALHQRSAEPQGVEPVSGRTGTGVAGEPYDAGNADDGNIDSFGTAKSGTVGYGDVSGHQQRSSGGLTSGTGLTSGSSGSAFTSGSSDSGRTSGGPLMGNTNSAYGTIRGSSHGTSSHGLAGSGTGTGTHTAYLAGAGLGSDRGLDNSGDKYLFNKHNAPGAGGRDAYYADDFTHANDRHVGSGTRVTNDTGSAVNSGKGERGAGDVGAGLASSGATERSRKPGFARQASGIASGSHGLNSGKPRESSGEKAAVVGAGLTGRSATKESGREPLSGVRGSGAGGEAYDRGNEYDSTQIGRATSGVEAMNINDRQGGAYDVSNAGGYGASTQTTGAFASSGAGSLKERVAGAPDPTGHADECEVGHHNAHPSGENAHQDGTHKPTYLNYRP